MRILLFAALLMVLACIKGECQETVFSLLKKDMRLADEYFDEKNFRNALGLYLNAVKKDGSGDITLRIARCYYFLKQFDRAVEWYEKYNSVNHNMPLTDLYHYAEALSSIKNYKKAIEYYGKYLIHMSDDQLVIKKIWRLTNLQFLYEDSSHFAVRPIQLNTGYGEFCAVPFRKGVVFISNRKEVQVVDKVDAASQAPFYRIYYSGIFSDTITHSGMIHYEKPSLFSKELNSRFHAGPVVFYHNNTKIVFTSTGNEAAQDGSRTLKLFFAENISGVWKVTGSYPFNSVDYSNSDPAINEDGNVLYFSSNMKGGAGGKDLYRSEYINGQWTKPVNLGEPVNTTHDEVFPFLHYNSALYFSSNGHAGLGGLDIFKSKILPDGFSEPENAGYPLNTNYDDFGLVIDSLNTHGYFSSNRKKGGFDDDLYEFDIDLQNYPLVISGLLKFKEHNWSDSSHLQALPNARLSLIDNIRDIVVHESVSDTTGNFSIVIPYFSQYKIKVIEEDYDEHIVSLEIPKHKKGDSKHEIVIIKDAFKSLEN